MEKWVYGRELREVKIKTKSGISLILKEQKDRTAVLMENKVYFFPYGINGTLEFLRKINIV